MSWAAVITAGGSLLGGVLGNKGAKEQGKAAQAGLDFTKGVYKDAQGNFSPYLGQGQTGVNGLAALAGGDYSGFINSPDYQFRIQQANDAFDSGAAARGRVFSGGAAADRDALNQGLASQALGDYRNSLQFLTQSGQNAAGTLGGIGSQTSQMVNGQYGQIGDAKASGYGAWAGALTGIGGAANNWLQGRGTAPTNYGSSYGGGSQAGQFGLPPPVDPNAWRWGG